MADACCVLVERRMTVCSGRDPGSFLRPLEGWLIGPRSQGPLLTLLKNASSAVSISKKFTLCQQFVGETLTSVPAGNTGIGCNIISKQDTPNFVCLLSSGKFVLTRRKEANPNRYGSNHPLTRSQRPAVRYHRLRGDWTTPLA